MIKGSGNYQKHKMKRLIKKNGKQFCLVYGLADQDGNVRYIGQTRQNLQARLAWHLKTAINSKSKLATWVKETQGVQIVLIDGNATWDVSEILTIDRYKREGFDLINVLRGGSDSLGAIWREAAP